LRGNRFVRDTCRRSLDDMLKILASDPYGAYSARSASSPLARPALRMYRSDLSDHVDPASHCDTDAIKVPPRQSLCGSLRESIPAMTTQRDKLREDVRFRILRLLQDNPEMTQRELAQEVGVSTGAFITCSMRWSRRGC